MRPCPVCKSEKANEILDLGNHPLADTFLPISRSRETEVVIPLVLAQCESCSHFFSGFSTDPESRYVANEYSYESANSKVSISHFGEFASACVQASNRSAGELSVLDIGSNDGTLLEQFRNIGVSRLVGIDPSQNMARIALTRNIRTEVGFFNPGQIPRLQNINSGAQFDLIVSANVVNHADDAHEFVQTVDGLLAEDGVYAFEVPNVVDLVQLRAFDTIYHEHVHYWSVESIRNLLGTYNFKILALEMLDYMCGSIRVLASRFRPESPAVMKMIVRDRASVVRNPEELEKFADDVRRIKFETLRFLANEKIRGRRIIGIGAATKGNTLLNYFGLGSDMLEFVTDTSLEKIGKITPGSKIPIVSDEALDGEKDGTLAVLLPWNLDSMLRRKFAGSNIEIFTPQIAFGGSSSAERPGLYGEA